MGIRAWFHFSGDDRASERIIRESLHAAGIGLLDLDQGEREAEGVLCFSEFSDAVVTSLHQISRTNAGRIIVLATSSAILPQGITWRLFHAGASDVLAWNRDGAVCEQVRSRLQRWAAVDELSDSACARVPLVGVSRTWRALVRRIVEAAHFTSAPVLLTGESGTGKELLARLIHYAHAESQDGSPEFVTVDCSTLVAELSGSELFGHERGAFTGAISARPGAFELADGGTLFLDEVGELPMSLQAQLLRAIQEKTYKRVGSNVWQTTDFRLVCATNRELADLVQRGAFRLDLYHRIAGWVFRTPPLRERREDIPPLATHFLTTSRGWEKPPELDETVSDYLLNRPYPGNIRELRQLMQRIAHRHVGPGPIGAGDIPEEDRPADGVLEPGWPGEHLERAIADAVTLGIALKQISQTTADMAIRIAIQSERGNLQRAARRLGVTDRALQMRRASGKRSG
jgi:transcriptional regulator with GAF, ATPase, and Fis domain